MTSPQASGQRSLPSDTTRSPNGARLRAPYQQMTRPTPSVDSDEDYNKHSESTSRQPNIATTHRTHVQHKVISKTTTTSSNGTAQQPIYHNQILEPRRSDRAKTPLEQLKESITNPLGHRIVMAGTSGMNRLRNAFSPVPESRDGETSPSYDTSASLGDNTTNDYIQLEREMRQPGARSSQSHNSQESPFLRGPTSTHRQESDARAHAGPSSGSRAGRHSIPDESPASTRNSASPVGQLVYRDGRMVKSFTAQQSDDPARGRNLSETASVGVSRRARHKPNPDNKTYRYNGEDLSEEDREASGPGIAANMPIRRTRQSLSSSQNEHPHMRNQHFNTTSNNDQRRGQQARQVPGQTPRQSGSSQIPASLSGASRSSSPLSEAEQDVFGNVKTTSYFKNGRNGFITPRAMRQQRDEQEQRELEALELEDTGSESEHKHSIMPRDKDDETYARESAPFNRASARLSKTPNGAVKPKRQGVIPPTPKTPFMQFMALLGIETYAGVIRLMGLVFFACWALVATVNLAKDIRQVGLNVSETISSFAGGASARLRQAPSYWFPSASVPAPTVTETPSFIYEAPKTVVDNSAWEEYKRVADERHGELDSEIKAVGDRVDYWSNLAQRSAAVTKEDLVLANKAFEEELRDQRAQGKRDIDIVRKELAGMRTAMNQVTGELAQQQSESVKRRSEVAGIMKELRRLDLLVRNQATDMVEVQSRLSKVESEMLKLFDERLWKETLERILPAHVPLRYDAGTDQVIADPAFWIEMKKMFATSSNIARPTWKDFVEENDDKLRVWLQESLGAAAEHTDKWTSASNFQDVLDREISELKSSLIEDMERRAAEGDVQVQVALEQMRVQAREMAGLQQDETLLREDLVDTPFSVRSLIDAALLKYSKDTIAKADYALGSSGAFINEAQTVPAIPLVRPGFFRHLFGSAGKGRHAGVVLSRENSPGFCYAFAGSEGSIGIELSAKVTVTDVTLEHAAKELVPEAALGSAPKEVEFWAVPGSQKSAEQIQGYLAAHPAHHEGHKEPVRGSILLTVAEYDPAMDQPIQTFQVPYPIRALGIATHNVIAKVNGNWGSKYTCVYRIRVHGELA